MALLKKQSTKTLRSDANLTDRIAEILMDEITSGQYAVGEVLPPELVIAERLGVSRTVLRESISRLKADGIVQSKQGLGLTVMLNTRPSVLRIHAAGRGDSQEVLRIIELRRGFETEAASLAATRRTPEDLVAIKAALDTMSTAIANDDVATGVEADLAFHRHIARATHNEHYLSFFEFLAALLKQNLYVSRSRSARFTGRAALAQREHEALYQAIEAGDAHAAYAHARTHVQNTIERLRSEEASAS